jgi:hypothetical protein
LFNGARKIGVKNISAKNVSVKNIGIKNIAKNIELRAFNAGGVNTRVTIFWVMIVRGGSDHETIFHEITGTDGEGAEAVPSPFHAGGGL